jgi:hypothetical protein
MPDGVTKTGDPKAGKKLLDGENGMGRVFPG